MDNVCSIVLANTSTIGLRIQPIGRRKLERKEIHIQTTFGQIRGKTVLRNGREATAPEFDECKRIADERGLPILDVMKLLDLEISRLSRT